MKTILSTITLIISLFVLLSCNNEATLEDDSQLPDQTQTPSELLAGRWEKLDPSSDQPQTGKGLEFIYGRFYSITNTGIDWIHVSSPDKQGTYTVSDNLLLLTSDSGKEYVYIFSLSNNTVLNMHLISPLDRTSQIVKYVREITNIDDGNLE